MYQNAENIKKRPWVKRLLPETLLGRSLLILIIPIFLIQIISTYIFFDRHWSKVTSRLAYAVAGEITILSDQVESRGNDKFDEIIAPFETNLGYLITYDADDIIDSPEPRSSMATNWGAMIKETLIKELNHVLRYPFRVNVDFQEKWVEVRVQLSGGVLNVSLSQRRLFSSTTYIFLLWIFAVSIILLIIAVLFMRNQIRPIRRLAVAAERFGKGRDVQNFKLEGAREVRQAGQAFLDMKKRIQRQISQRTDMLAGVSHDLRTPLTRLKIQIAMLGDSPDIFDMKNDIRDMEKMIEGYLNFVRGEGSETTSVMDMHGLLKDVTISTKRQGCDVELDVENGSVYIPLKQMAFKRCLLNIMSNAAKYSDFIWVTLEKTADKEIHIRIEDNGPGIKEDQFESVFRPFFRVDSSRNMDTGGVGLGLPIAMDIVHSHGGEIWLEKSQHGGLAVNITLPV